MLFPYALFIINYFENILIIKYCIRKYIYFLLFLITFQIFKFEKIEKDRNIRYS